MRQERVSREWDNLPPTISGSIKVNPLYPARGVDAGLTFPDPERRPRNSLKSPHNSREWLPGRRGVAAVRLRRRPGYASGDQGVCPGMQKVFWRQKCPGTRGVRDNRRPGTVLAVPGHLASSQDTYAVLGRCCPKTANCPGTGAGVPGPPSWDTRCPGTPRVPGHFLVLWNAPP